MAFTTPLDLKTIFVDYFAGGLEIFMFLSVVVLAYLAAKYKLPNYVFMMLLAVYVIFMAAVSPGFELLLVLMIIVTGLVGYWILSKVMKT